MKTAKKTVYGLSLFAVLYFWVAPGMDSFGVSAEQSAAALHEGNSADIGSPSCDECRNTQEGDDPPHNPGESQLLWLKQVSAEQNQDRKAMSKAFGVNPQTRAESKGFYSSIYLGSQGITENWTGQHSTCVAGTTAQNFRDAVLLRINYFRAMSGVPAGITFSDTYVSKAQEAALMMSVNNTLSHYPTSDWLCYTENGADGAHNSNLFLGYSGATAIDGYIQDLGDSNYFIGHRRWILYPQTQFMGTGDTPYIGNTLAANALWVIDSNYGSARPATRDGYVAWPPPGYVPYQVTYPRWSLSYPDADFSQATVSMTVNGTNFPVRVETVKTGYAENTLVWIPTSMSSLDTWPRPDSDTIYTVSISGGGYSFAYSVTIFDPTKTVSGVTTNLSPVYRLYSYGAAESTFEHLFTTSANEKDALSSWPSWQYEGIAWYAYTNEITGTVPLYRLYASSIKQHHSTTDPVEYFVNSASGSWSGEGVQYYVYASQATNTAPVYRFYHATSYLHHFTIDETEKESIGTHPEWGYAYEGVAFYVFPSNSIPTNSLSSPL